MKKGERNRVLSVLLAMVTAISLLSRRDYNPFDSRFRFQGQMYTACGRQ